MLKLHINISACNHTPVLFSCIFWECLQNSFEKLLVAFAVQVCELFVYNRCIHSCQLKKHRNPFNRNQLFPSIPLEQPGGKCRSIEKWKEQKIEMDGAGRSSGSHATHVTLPAALLFFPHTDMTWASSAPRWSASAFRLILVLTYDLQFREGQHTCL